MVLDESVLSTLYCAAVNGNDARKASSHKAWPGIGHFGISNTIKWSGVDERIASFGSK